MGPGNGAGAGAGAVVDAVVDAVVVGGGTVGAWCAFFLARSGVGRVVLLEQGVLGCGASSRAAGMVRAQGGTPLAVRLGMWSQDFYRSQAESLGVDSGFVEQGYFMPAFSDEEVAVGQRRVEMQRSVGLADVSWLSASEAEALSPSLARGSCLGGSYAPRDGYLDPPRNVVAYSVALRQAGVEVRERCTFTGLRLAGGRVTGVETSAGFVSTRLVVLTGGPSLRAVGERCGVVVHAGGTRHQVAVTEPSALFRAEVFGPMVFDIGAGLYWRPEDGGLLFGMSNPLEPPGDGREVDWPYLESMRGRLSGLVPASGPLGLRRVWAATIDYTPDHLPILGPAFVGGDPSEVLEGAFVAAAGGHGMMWGPAVARLAACLAVGDSAGVAAVADPADVAAVGLDRFDASGRSRLEADPIALPFPERVSQDRVGEESPRERSGVS